MQEDKNRADRNKEAKPEPEEAISEELSDESLSNVAGGLGEINPVEVPSELGNAFPNSTPWQKGNAYPTGTNW